MRLVTQRMKLTERPYSLSRQGPFFPLVLFRIVILFWVQSELFQPNKIAFLSLAFLRMDREVSASRLAETSRLIRDFRMRRRRSEMNETKAEPPKCPECGSSKALPILYGYPSSEALKGAEEGKIVLGGCCDIEGAPMPIWRCAECSHKWGELRMAVNLRFWRDDE